jgi:hypothetical protein
VQLAQLRQTGEGLQFGELAAQFGDLRAELADGVRLRVRHHGAQLPARPPGRPW